MEKSLLEKLIKDSHGICLNASDFFNYSCADMIILTYEDLAWALPIFEKYDQDGINACMCYIRGLPPIKEHINEIFDHAFDEIVKLNPQVTSE